MSNTKQQKMFEDILAWQRSGLSQKAWCEQQKIAYSVFHYWYRRFRNQQAYSRQVANDSFVQLMVQDRPAGSLWGELLLGDGKKLIFYQPVAPAFIRSLLD